MTRLLDLGCGKTPRNHYNADEPWGLDIEQVDLCLEPIPFADNTFEYVTAFDFLEHIPRLLYIPHRKLPFVDLMSEVWRVLKVDGLFYSSTPAFPHAPAFQDPTHVNIITPLTFAEYFDDEKIWARNYGFKGAFHIEKLEYFGPHIRCEMRKVIV
jgi:SAM-dependent methyltransferase